MKNPNAIAASVAAALSIGLQWLVQRYGHVALSDYWKTAATSAFTVAVLYVGRNGVKQAVLRLVDGPRKAWSGSDPAQPSSSGK